MWDGAVELENTDRPPWRLTPAVAPFSRAVNGDGAAVADGTPGEAWTRGETWTRGLVAVAPLVDPVAEAPVFTRTAVGAAGACAVGDVTCGEPPPTLDAGAGWASFGAGLADGVAGVPKPDGVQAHARPAPTAATPTTDSTAKLNLRPRLCTFPPFEGRISITKNYHGSYTPHKPSYSQGPNP